MKPATLGELLNVRHTHEVRLESTPELLQHFEKLLIGFLESLSTLNDILN